MYTAKQEIAELTIYGFFATTANVVILYYMITHDGPWLVWFSFFTTLISVLPSFILSFLALHRYAECRFVRAYLWDFSRVRELFKFAFARFWTALSQVVSSQGCAILVNKYMGPSFNAAISVGTSVSSHACTLSGAISGAFWPVIANKAGERDYDGMRRFAFQTCRISTAMILIFAVPLAIEVKLVLKLWLVTPPESAWAICTAILVGLVLERLTEGYWMAIIGEGSHVSLYSLVVSISGFSCFVFTWIFLGTGFGVLGYCVSIVLGWLVTVAVRLVLGRTLVAMSARHWLHKVCIPIVTATALAIPAGCLVRASLPESFLRVCLTTLACEAVLVPLLWFLAFGRDEREYVMNRLRRFLPSRARG
jgi:Na+-driven multidrug efflux pump